MFDHNNSIVGHRNYRKIELSVIYFVGFILIIYTLLNVFSTVVFNVRLYNEVNDGIEIIVQIYRYMFFVYAGLVIMTVSILFFKMWKRHKYEFKRNILRFTVYIIAFSGSDLYWITYSNIYPDQKDLREYSKQCEIQSHFLQTLLFYTLFYFPIAACILVIKIKKDDDILQCISKLDMLLKISRFQVYKDKSINKESVLESLDRKDT